MNNGTKNHDKLDEVLFVVINFILELDSIVDIDVELDTAPLLDTRTGTGRDSCRYKHRPRTVIFGNL